MYQQLHSELLYLKSPVLDFDWGYLYGYLIGDGCLAKNDKKVTWVATEDSLPILLPLIDSKLGVHFTLKSNSKCTDIQAWGVKYCRDLKGLGFKLGCKNKVIPDFLLGDREVERGVLQGLFDSDGSVSVAKRKVGNLQVQVTFISTSIALAEQVATLLQFMGVPARFGGPYRRSHPLGWNETFSVGVYSKSGCALFARLVNFRLPRKTSKLREYYA